MIEYSNLIDLLQAFFLINDTDKIKDEKNQALYNKFIVEKIKEIYFKYSEKVEDKQSDFFYKIKDFIVTLLLKFEHRRHLTFRVYGISGIRYRPLFRIEESANHARIGEIFYEFQDRLMIIPQICIQHLKSCTEGKIQGVIFDFYTKY